MTIAMCNLTSADGTALAVEATGSGTPLILLHGGMTSTRVFDRVLPTLAQHHRCLALGRRNYGQSGTSPTHSYESEADGIVAVLATLDEPAHLFGHSSGALAAATAALRLTGTPSLRSLILYEPPFPIDHPHDGPWIDAMEAAIARGDNEAAALIGLRDGVGFTDEQLTRVRADPSWLARTALAPAWAGEVRSVEALPIGVERFKTITTPTLLVTGSQTQPHHTAAINALHDTLPDSTLAVLEGQGHAALLLAPDQFCETVLPFLMRH